MIPIESLAARIKQRFPGANVHADPPEVVTGSWFLDIHWNGVLIVVDWSLNRPDDFGITADIASHGFGEGADEYATGEDRVYERLVELMEKAS